MHGPTNNLNKKQLQSIHFFLIMTDQLIMYNLVITEDSFLSTYKTIGHHIKFNNVTNVHRRAFV